MEYKLLNDNNGIILSREPEVVSEKLSITFIGAPEKATAIFERIDGESVYRALSDGLCIIETNWLKGPINVTVAVLDGSMKSKRWSCERFYVKEVENGAEILVYPYDIDMQGKLAKLQECVSDLKTANKELTEKYKTLETKINKILEGYDIV